MLTSILRSNTIAAFVLSFLLGGIMLLVPCLLWHNGSSGVDLLYAHWAFAWLQTSQGFAPYLCLLVVSAVAILSRLHLREAKQVFGNRNLGMVVLVSLVMTQPQAVFARPDVLVASLVVLAMFLVLLSTYKRDPVLSEVFHVGLLLGVAGLFVGQSVFLILPIAFSLLVLRTGNVREWIVLGLGLVMTAVFVMMYAIWQEAPLLAFMRVIQSAWSGSVGSERLNAGHVALIPVTLLGLSVLMGSLTGGTVTERNMMLTNGAWIVGTILVLLLLGVGWQNGIVLMAYPLSILISLAIEKTSRWWLADLLLATVIAAPFVSNLWRL